MESGSVRLGGWGGAVYRSGCSRSRTGGTDLLVRQPGSDYCRTCARAHTGGHRGDIDGSTLLFIDVQSCCSEFMRAKIS